jgi:hypothetical protein
MKDKSLLIPEGIENDNDSIVAGFSEFLSTVPGTDLWKVICADYARFQATLASQAASMSQVLFAVIELPNEFG